MSGHKKVPKVWFIGAGPGAPDLITVRGKDVLSKADIAIYAGSLVDEKILDYCADTCTRINSANLTLEEQIEIYRGALDRKEVVARIHSGDPSIYGAMAEQIAQIEAIGMDYEIVPGVSSFTAAAACAGCELTKPGYSQSVILTRFSGRASSVPESESIRSLASHCATMCIFLSGNYLVELVQQLLESYTDTTPVLLVQKATWREERVYKGTLSSILTEVVPEQWRLTTMIIVGDVLRDDLLERSQLYSPQFAHRYRKAQNINRSEESYRNV